ncbi:MAG: hypothetical protein R6V01_08035 [Thermoplasmatota archaeon]
MIDLKPHCSPLGVAALLLLLSFVHPIHCEGSEIIAGRSRAKGIYETYIEGNIEENITFDEESSPVYINRTITINETTRVSLLSGCTVIMGQGASLMIKGQLVAEGEGSDVTIRGASPGSRGYWEGIDFLNGSKGRFEGANISGANITLCLDSTTDVVVRNSSFGFDNVPVMLNGSSELQVYNSSMDYKRIMVLDNTSALRPHHFLGGTIVDHLGRSVEGARVLIEDHEASTVLSYITNSTGEFPHQLLEGAPIKKSDPASSAGAYNISVWDNLETYYRNITYRFNATSETHIEVRLSWPPELSSVPERMNLVEDSLAYHYTNVLDRNDVGYVGISTSSPRVWYNRTMERLEFLYTNETYLNENVTVTLDDGYDTRSYTILVKVYPVDDPPQVTFQGGFMYPKEEEPAYYSLDIFDEDTPFDQIEVTTDDPLNVSFDRNNSRLVFLYGDGTPLEFSVNVTVSDGNSSVGKEISVFFQPVFYRPEFLLPLPEFTTYEDEDLVVDLGPYITDPDEGERLFLSAMTRDHEIFSVTLDGFVITLLPAPDAYGEGSLQLTLEDERDLSTVTYVNVTVLPVDDEPKLISPSVEKAAIGIYWFNITYGDMDGDMPDRIHVSIDEREHEMTVNMVPLPDPTIGIRYHLRSELSPGTYEVSFHARQGPFTLNVTHGYLTVPLQERSFELRGYNGSLSVSIWEIGEGIPPHLIEVQDGPELEKDSLVLNCSFRIDHRNLTPTKAWITVWPLEIRSDVMVRSLEVRIKVDEEWIGLGGGIYDSAARNFSFSLRGAHLNSTIAVIARLDPESDSDNDGVKNFLDDFPFDPDEWRDTDGDGIGDNADEDDDNDGFTDEFELRAGTDPLSDSSFPVDTDFDGLYDHEDNDDDGDGMPDQWENENGLDPLDPSDAHLDPDRDGTSNLEEYLRGTDPRHDDRDVGDGDKFQNWMLVVSVLLLLLLLLGGIALLILSRGRHRKEIEEADSEWEVQGELEPEEAVDCPDCGSVYPLWFDECPRCGETNPYEE